MPYLDRASFIALLDRLGSADDSEALAAAREIDRRKRDAGATWADLLALIERLLADHDLSEDTRRELLDFRDDIAEGEFTEMDSRYLRNLEARLNRRSGSAPDV
jgi:hypothetical protein